MEKTKNKEIRYVFGLILVPVFVLFGFAFYNKNVDQQNQTASPHTEVSEDKEMVVFENVALLARAAIVKDLNTGEVWYSKNEKMPLPLASLTKIMTAVVAENKLQQNVVAVSWEDLQTEGESFFFLGEQFRKNDLIDLTMVSSSNDGASALAASTFAAAGLNKKDIFVSEMNDTARRIGMKDTFFLNETGLDITTASSTKAGAHGSATDIATLLEYSLTNYPEIFDKTTQSFVSIKSINGFVHPATNTNEIAGELPNLIASKTGLTNIAGGNLAVVIDPALNNPIAIVVLGSTEEGRFSDVQKLADEAVRFLATKK
jgi:D-alanyl-D-alanine carboxypeptidase (penicillin-binding protein 5/6)